MNKCTDRKKSVKRLRVTTILLCLPYFDENGILQYEALAQIHLTYV